MSGLNEIINEIKTILGSDTDIADFCNANYSKPATVRSGDFIASDVPVSEMPVIIIGDNCDEREKRRFLFCENEANILIVCGVLQNAIEKVGEDLTSLKELIKAAVKKDPQLQGVAVYSVITKSRRLKTIGHPLYFIELSMYVNYRGF